MNISRYEYVKKLAKDRNIIYKHLTETLGPEQAQLIFKEAYTKKNAEQAKQIAEETNIQSFEDYKRYIKSCLLYTSPSPRDLSTSRMPSSA